MVPYVAVTTADRIGAITYFVITRGPSGPTLAEDRLEVSSTTDEMSAPGVARSPVVKIADRPEPFDAPGPRGCQRAMQTPASPRQRLPRWCQQTHHGLLRHR